MVKWIIKEAILPTFDEGIRPKPQRDVKRWQVKYEEERRSSIQALL
jgi:hypothetical protein